MNKYKLIGRLLGLCFLFFISLTHAACKLLSLEPMTTTYPLPFTSISPRQSNNSEVTIMSLYVTQSMTAVCDKDWYFVSRLENTLAYTGQNTSSGGFPIYKTSVNGVGVYTHFANLEGVAGVKTPGGTRNSKSGVSSLYVAKISNNTASGILRGTSLPSLVTYVTESANGIIDSSALKVSTVSYTGQTNFMVPTCKAEDKNIWLGQHNLSDFISSDVTDWVNASITMTCDREFSNAKNSAEYNIHGKLTTTISPNNYYSVTVQAVNGFTNRNRGIMALEANGATGIGIQISRTQAEQNWSSLTWTDLNTPAANTIKIPLYARYIKTGNTVTAGQANGKLIYTVQYK